MTSFQFSTSLNVKSEDDALRKAFGILTSTGWVPCGIDDNPREDAVGSRIPARKYIRWGSEQQIEFSRYRDLPTAIVEVTTQIMSSKGSKPSNGFKPCVQLSISVACGEVLRLMFVDPSRVQTRLPSTSDALEEQGTFAVHFPSLIEVRVCGPITPQPHPMTATDRALHRRDPTRTPVLTTSDAYRSFHDSTFSHTLPDRLSFLRVSWSSHPLLQVSAIPTCVALSCYPRQVKGGPDSAQIAAALYQDIRKVSSSVAWEIRARHDGFHNLGSLGPSTSVNSAEAFKDVKTSAEDDSSAQKGGRTYARRGSQ